MQDSIVSTSANSLALAVSPCSPLTSMRAMTVTLVINGARFQAASGIEPLCCITSVFVAFESQHRHDLLLLAAALEIVEASLDRLDPAFQIIDTRRYIVGLFADPLAHLVAKDFQNKADAIIKTFCKPFIPVSAICIVHRLRRLGAACRLRQPCTHVALLSFERGFALLTFPLLALLLLAPAL